MANFYARYPANNISASAIQTVQGEGTAGTPVGGILTVQGDPSGTPIPVSVGASATIIWQAEGSLAFGSITNTYQTIFTPSAATKIMFMRNNTNQSISVSMDAGTTTNFIFDSGDQLAVDFASNGLVSTTAAIQIKYTSTPPTSGSFRVNGGH